MLSTAKRLGASKTFLKPVEPEELLVAIEDALRGELSTPSARASHGGWRNPHRFWLGVILHGPSVSPWLRWA